MGCKDVYIAASSILFKKTSQDPSVSECTGFCKPSGHVTEWAHALSIYMYALTHTQNSVSLSLTHIYTHFHSRAHTHNTHLEAVWISEHTHTHSNFLSHTSKQCGYLGSLSSSLSETLNISWTLISPWQSRSVSDLKYSRPLNWSRVHHLLFQPVLSFPVLKR